MTIAGQVRSMAKSDVGGGNTPPRISFSRFLDCIEWLEETGVPSRFDYAFWSLRYNSRNVGPSLASALGFLGLLKGGIPQPSLKEVVQARSDERKKLLRDLFQTAYAHVDFQLLPKATSGMVAEWMGKYALEGDAKRKAEVFLINGLMYTDTPMSPGLKKGHIARRVKTGEVEGLKIEDARPTGGTRQGVRRKGQLPDLTGQWLGNARDDRQEVVELFSRLKEKLPELDKLLQTCNDEWVYEDSVYRFYYQSYKVYNLQDCTEKMVEALKSLLPETPLNDWFLKIVHEGTGKEFSMSDNDDWLTVTRPIIEAFFHARFFLEMAVRYGRQVDFQPSTTLPSGWAAFLCLYNLR